LVDYAVDFHAGGASRFNAPQIRLAPNNPELITLANVLMHHSLYFLKMLQDHLETQAIN
jgi:hypothetical protein